MLSQSSSVGSAWESTDFISQTKRLVPRIGWRLAFRKAAQPLSTVKYEKEKGAPKGKDEAN
jgi:hypothetical protein